MTTIKEIATRAVGQIGINLPIERIVPAYGGDINENHIVELGRGEKGSSWEKFFLKVQHNSPERFFEAEAEGLKAIQAALSPPVPRTPEVLGIGRLGTSHYLAMEYIHPGNSGKATELILGRQLAQLHRGGRAELFGFPHDNFIGRTPQVNTFMSSWIDFFRENRLGYQIRIADNRNLLNLNLRKQLDKVLDRLELLLDEPDFPSLIHGDLWGGNVMTANTGEPVIIDPAVYYGHPEADIAMTELFGGFSRKFYDGYYEINPRDPGYKERKELYNLYHMLNHLNLFGSSYESAIKSIVSRYM